MDARTAQAIMHKIKESEQSILALTNERKEAYDKVKDFSTADARKTDIAIAHMRRIDIEVRKLKKEIDLAKAKLSK